MAQGPNPAPPPLHHEAPYLGVVDEDAHHSHELAPEIAKMILPNGEMRFKKPTHIDITHTTQPTHTRHNPNTYKTHVSHAREEHM